MKASARAMFSVSSALRSPLLLAALVPLTAALSLGEASDMNPRNYPVTRVVKLLQDMKKQLEKEADSDEEVYSKLACWCETNDKAKTQAIADAEARIANLEAKIETLTAESGRLSEEIASLEQEVAKNQEALDKATALRTKQLAEFNEDEKEMLASIQALGQAVVVLSKHHKGGGDSAALASVAATVSSQLSKHKTLLMGTITPHQKHMIASLVQEPTGGGFKAYKAQSGEIFGILNQMKANFEENLAASQKEELENQKSYTELKAAKEEQIKFGKASLFDKTQQKATADENLAMAKQDAQDTADSLSADQRFLMDLKQRCALTDKEWEERQKTRNEELVAVAKAISVLSGDDAKDVFSRTFNPAAFIQARAERRGLVKRAADVLVRAASKANDPKLAMLASAVRLDAFKRVKQAIDDMVAQLLKESADEITHRDTCIDDLNKNELTTQEKLHLKTNTEQHIEGHKLDLKALVDQIAVLQAEITDLGVQKQRATADRQAQHAEFQGVVADQRDTQTLLTKAKDVLTDYYRKETEAFLQRANPDPPAGFKSYEKQGGAADGVIALLSQIIADAKEMEAEMTHDEDEAQKAHDSFVEETDAAVEAKQGDVVNKNAVKAQTEQDLTQAEEELAGTVTELENLASTAGALHKTCDYFLKNFDVRQEARDQEVEALRQAKAILSGMKVQA